MAVLFLARLLFQESIQPIDAAIKSPSVVMRREGLCRGVSQRPVGVTCDLWSLLSSEQQPRAAWRSEPGESASR